MTSGHVKTVAIAHAVGGVDQKSYGARLQGAESGALRVFEKGTRENHGQQGAGGHTKQKQEQTTQPLLTHNGLLGLPEKPEHAEMSYLNALTPDKMQQKRDQSAERAEKKKRIEQGQ
jgi:hypothetical protein